MLKIFVSFLNLKNFNIFHKKLIISPFLFLILLLDALNLINFNFYSNDSEEENWKRHAK